jgi:two-component system LytT family response regulator
MAAPGVPTLRVVIVDDEPLARDVLRRMLETESDIDVVGEAGDGRAAVELIEHAAPDLVFLDVQMPEQDGFAVLRAISPARLPAVVFITAYDQYAIRAFEVHALDYLLKPFDEERLAVTLGRARTRRMHRPAPQDEGSDAAHRLLHLLREIDAARSRIDRITVREGERIFFVPVRDVEWLEASGKYVRVHTATTTHQVREPIGRIEQLLDPRRFARVSRFAIVNVDRIRELQPWFQGEYQIVMASGARITTTRGYRDQVNALLGR